MTGSCVTCLTCVYWTETQTLLRQRSAGREQAQVPSCQVTDTDINTDADIDTDTNTDIDTNTATATATDRDRDTHRRGARAESECTFLNIKCRFELLEFVNR